MASGGGRGAGGQMQMVHEWQGAPGVPQGGTGTRPSGLSWQGALEKGGAQP